MGSPRKKSSVPNQPRQLCHCNCGRYAKPGNKFINGHYHPRGIPRKVWPSYQQAREYIRSFAFKNQKEYRKYCRSGKKPDDIPSTPEKTYKDKGWIGYPDFLGYTPRQMRPGSAVSYIQARRLLEPLNIPDQKTFLQLSSQKKLPKGIPGNPPKAYKDKGWIGYPDFLGYDRKRHESYDISYDEAKKLLHPLKIRSIRSFKDLRKQGKLPKGVPCDPYDLFKDRGWVGLICLDIPVGV